MTVDIKKDISNLTILAPFSYPLLAFPIKEIKGSIAATDGISLFINRNRFEKLNEKEKLFVLLHEWLHVVLLDCANKTKDHRVLNFASDFRINQMIINEISSYMQPIKGCLHDRGLSNMNSDIIYSKLKSEMRERKQNGYVPKCIYCNKPYSKYDVRANDEETKCGACYRANDVNIPTPDFLDFEFAVNFLMEAEYNLPFSEDARQLPSGQSVESIIDNILKAFDRYGKGIGKLSAGLLEHIENLKKSNVPWERLLMKYAKESLAGSMDRSSFKPDPKYIINDIVVPTECSNRTNKIILILDTSGSMSIDNLEGALGQIQRLSKFCEKLTVITADAEIKGIFKIKNIKNELRKNKFYISGRGGTDMRPALEKADKMRPNLIIIYTDMALNFPPKPKSNLIWLSCSDYKQKVPYGRLINVINRERDR